MFNKSDANRNQFMLEGELAKCGYDWWWHSFTARHEKTGREKAFFIEFFACNPDLGTDEPIFGQLPENKENGVKPSYVMVKVGTWGKDAKQVHNFWSWDEVILEKGSTFMLNVGECFVNEKKTFGKVSMTEEEAKNHPEYMSDAGEFSWDLKIKKKIAFNVGYGASKLFRKLNLFEMFWHAEGMKTLYEGEITVDGEKYIVSKDNCYGYADKNWGKNFTSPWVWLSSNNMTSLKTGKKLANSVFDIGGGRPKIGVIPLNKKLLTAFYYEGNEFEFNFSKFWTLPRTKFECSETRDKIIWVIEQKNLFSKMEAWITCEKKDMLLVNYEAPTGEKRHNRLWNGGNGVGTIKLYRFGKLVDEIEAKNIGCEYGEFGKLDPNEGDAVLK